MFNKSSANKKYQLIKGIVSDLQISHGYEDLVFIDSIKNTAGLLRLQLL
ncbi:hypothetical protein [Iodobacter ciconiae]|nr:hypothetical protein [Iodobacter ciconiae]